MAFSIGGVLNALQGGLAVVEQFSPLIGLIPGGGLIQEAIDIVQSVNNVATAVKERAAEGTIVLSTTDEAELNRILARLQVENDKLMALVDAS